MFLHFSMEIQHFMSQRGKDSAALSIYFAVISQITIYEIAEDFRHFTYAAKMDTTNHVEYY